MKEERDSRTKLLIGEDKFSRLKSSRVIVFGVGGVGGYVVEALVRAGIGCIDIVDNDVVSESNINRQIIATYDTIGEYKTEVMRARAISINPEIRIKEHRLFYLPESADEIDLREFDYIVDAVDTITAKIEIIKRAEVLGIPIISSMGTGNKLDATAFSVCDIYETEGCPLARVMRRELRTLGIKKLKVVYSKEKAIKPVYAEEQEIVPASISYNPGVCGLILSYEVIKDLMK